MILLVPKTGANLTYQMFFYADDDRCALPKYDFFRPKFKTQLCELLGISMKRMKITGCTAAAVIGITMHFYIIDVVGERRNINIQAHMQDIMEKESFIVQMNQVSLSKHNANLILQDEPFFLAYLSLHLYSVSHNNVTILAVRTTRFLTFDLDKRL